MRRTGTFQRRISQRAPLRFQRTGLVDGDQRGLPFPLAQVIAKFRSDQIRFNRSSGLPSAVKDENRFNSRKSESVLTALQWLGFTLLVFQPLT